MPKMKTNSSAAKRFWKNRIGKSETEQSVWAAHPFTGKTRKKKTPATSSNNRRVQADKQAYTTLIPYA